MTKNKPLVCSDMVTERLEEIAQSVPQFSKLEKNWCDYDEKWEWSFECAMVGYCSPLFDNCEDNYMVRDLLKKAGVIHHRNQIGAETCAVYGYLASQKSADAFINRLNRFLVEEWGEVPLSVEGL